MGETYLGLDFLGLLEEATPIVIVAAIFNDCYTSSRVVLVV
jgi:hypothetical protein